MELLNKKKVGILGYGIVGKSLLNVLPSIPIKGIGIYDKHPLHTDDKLILTTQGIAVYEPEDINAFLSEHDVLIASPGIDIHPFADYADKFVAELDLFYSLYHKPIIAITGSVGKTTVTTLLSSYCNNLNSAHHVGGNIGQAAHDLIHSQKNDEFSILEVSSFQLEHIKAFAPDIAIWTNFYPNHLDRHTSIEQYFTAKLSMFTLQNNHQKALVPLAVAPQLTDEIISRAYFFTSNADAAKQGAKTYNRPIFFCDETSIKMRVGMKEKILLHPLPSLATHKENLLIVASAISLLEKPLNAHAFSSIALPHRMQYLYNNEFIIINDSKSTIMPATHAAISYLQQVYPHHDIHLLLGGLSKGVDRSEMLQQLAHTHVKHIYCFGAQADLLKDACDAAHISAQKFSSLEEAVVTCFKQLQKQEIMLLSPGGSSFDLFKNYEERGEVFKHVVQQLIDHKNVNISSLLSESQGKQYEKKVLQCF